MRIREPGKITDRLFFLGREESCLYLVEGEAHSMIISGGMSYLVSDLLDQFKTFGIDETRIHKLLILHAHFDHVGTVPFLKRRFPHMEVYASGRAWELLATPRVIHTINAFSLEVAKRNGMAGVYDTYDLKWRDDVKGIPVHEGERIDLGGLDVELFDTPGHSSCSMSAYIPRLKALFASDGGGIPYKNTIIASGNSNYTRYQQSLEKLRHLDVRFLCADHYGYIEGDEAQAFIPESIKTAKARRGEIQAIYNRTGSIDATVEEMARSFYQNNADYILTPEITRGIYRQLVRHIAGAMAEKATK